MSDKEYNQIQTISRDLIKRIPKNDMNEIHKVTSTGLNAVNMYAHGKSVSEISKLTNWTEKSIKGHIKKHFMALKTLIETEALVEAQASDDGRGITGGSNLAKSSSQVATFKNQKKIDENVNKDFIANLSERDDRLLTNEEVMFCYLYVHEGDAKKALIDSGLSKGLIKTVKGYERACKLRVLILKGKRNIIKYINDLQIDYAKEININKEVIQTTILTQLEQLKEQNNPRNAPTIAKLTEQLGRTVGAFSDKIVIEEVSFDDAMDRMLDMRKEQKKNSDNPDAYVYDPEAIK